MLVLTNPAVVGGITIQYIIYIYNIYTRQFCFFFSFSIFLLLPLFCHSSLNLLLSLFRFSFFYLFTLYYIYINFLCCLFLPSTFIQRLFVCLYSCFTSFLFSVKFSSFPSPPFRYLLKLSTSPLPSLFSI